MTGAEQARRVDVLSVVADELRGDEGEYRRAQKFHCQRGLVESVDLEQELGC
jgi:hypothetical protein